MNRKPRWRRRALVALAVLACLAAVALLGVRLYLTPARSADILRAEIARALGAEATLESASVGLFGETSVTGLVIPDPGGAAPFLTASEARLGLSAVGSLLGRRLPTDLRLDGVALTLRFDRDGNLLTKLPTPAGGGAFPAIDIRDARVTILQEGRRPFTLGGISATTRGEAITGTAADPDWGTFALSGSLKGEPAELALKLKHASADITPERLRSIPFVPTAVWDTIEAKGSSPLDVSLTFLGTSPYVKYGVGFSGLPLALIQAGRPPFRVEKASGTLDGDADTGFSLTGKLEDAAWGKWDAGVTLSNSDAETRITLKAPPVAVDPKKLATLPYVPAAVWEQVSVTGRTPADVLVRLSTRTDKVNYRVTVEPADSLVSVPSIGLNTRGVSGRAVIEDGLVTLEKVKGEAAGGTLGLNATLDFRGEATAMRFGLAVRGLGLRALPAKWELPKQLDGKITGDADLRLAVAGGKVKTSGSGKGRIDEATLAGFPVKHAIELRLQAEDGRIRFQPNLEPTALDDHLIFAAAPPPPPRPTPGSLAGSAANAVGSLARLAARGAGRLLDGMSWAEKLTRPGRPDTYLDARFALEDIDLVELAKRVEMPLPEGFSGRVSVDVNAGIPLNNAGDARAYRLQGKATSKRLLLAGVPLEDVKATLNYDKGLARLEGLSARLGSGRVSGTARAAISPPGDVVLTLDLENIEVSSLRALLPEGLRREATGTVSGRVSVAAPWDRAGDVLAYRGSGRLRAVNAGAFRVAAREAEADFLLNAGTLILSHLRADILGADITGEAGLNLRPPYRYTGTAAARGLDVALVPGIPAGLEGGVDASGKFAGSLGSASGAGRVRGTALRFMGLRAGPLQAKWSLADGKLVLTEVQGTFERGLVTGGGDLGPGAAGKLLLRVAGVDAAALGKRIPALGTLAGTIDAAIRAQLQPAGADVDVDLSSSRLRVGFIPLTRPKARVEMRGGRLSYTAEGEVFGGRMRTEGKWPPPPMGSVGQAHGRLRLQGVEVGRLASALGLGRGLSGQLFIDLPYRHDGPGGAPVGTGRFGVRDLRQGDAELADSIRGEVRLTPAGVFLRDVTGGVAGGQLRLQVSRRFNGGGWMDVSLTGADSGQLLAALGMDEETMSGPVEIRLRGEIGEEWTASGNLLLSRGKVLNVPVSEWNAPLDVAFSPEMGRATVQIRDSTAQVGGGRARLRAEARVGERVRVEGVVQLIDAGTASLAGLIGDVSSFARGRVTGRVDFAGSDVRSADDIGATVSATLRETQAGQLPILRALVPVVGPVLSSSVFEKGQIRGRLSGGVFRINELSLEGSSAQMWIDGTITTRGRLDLSVLARTSLSGRSNPILLRTLLRQVPAIGPVPVGLILRVLEAASDRVLYLKVTGTAKTPVVRAEALRILSDEAGRFLLRLVQP